MNAAPLIVVHSDRKCAECGESGTAANTPLCIRCVGKVIIGAQMHSPEGRAAQERINGDGK